MKDRKKEITLLIIGILTLVSLVVGATYAFFKAQTGPAANFNVITTTGTTDNLTFTTVGNILINASANNFAKGSEDLNGTITATASLIANDSTNTTEPYYYNVYLEVMENELEYSSFKDHDGELPNLVFKTRYDKTLGNNIDYRGVTNGYDPIPELYLTITGPNGYKFDIDFPVATLKNEDDSYDITELREGIYPLVLNKSIQVGELDNGTKKEEWKVKVTLKNLDSNQQLNTGKTFNAKVIIQAEKIPMNLMDVCSEGDNLANCIQLLHDKSEFGASNLLYHDGKADYEGEENYTLEAGDNSYRYSGSYEKVNNYICFGTKCSTDPKEEGYNNLYRIIGTFGSDGIKLVKADYANKELLGEGTQKPTGDLSQANPETNGSHYTGNPYRATTGTNGEKDAYIHRYYQYKGNLTQVDRYRWQENGNDKTAANWNTSLLNNIHLNTNYYNSIDSTYRSLIKGHIWIWGNNNATYNNIALGTNAKSVYDNEIGANSKTNQKTTDSENIGLLYVSDYLYGATPNNWSKQPFNNKWSWNDSNGITDKFGNPTVSFNEHEEETDYRSATDSNWLYMGLWDWLITQRHDDTNGTDSPVYAFPLDASGRVRYNYVGTNSFVVRPTFYLDSSMTKYKSGTGTINDPYTLQV